MRNEVAVVLLTWQRVPSLRNTLKRLSVQTYDKFDVYISNGNTAKAAEVEDIAKQFDGELDIWVSHDGNRHFAFRRMFIGRYLAQNNYKKIMFIDDDISFSEQYVDNVLSQWKPKTYKSAYAWDIKGENYYDRTRVTSPKQRVKYCGTGASLVDSRLFLEDGLVFNYPKQAEKIEDLWMSFYVDHKLRGWKLGHLDCPDIIIGGNDRHALFRDVNNSQYNKTDFLQDLIKMGWRI
jgi:hypothetical protein